MSTETPTSPIDEACSRTDEVQRELEVASAELGLTHRALDRHLPPTQRTGDVAWAIAQNEVLERKVQQAAEDLSQVCELLEQVRAEVRAD
ncbi:MAG: hypothetical protein JWP65_2835 [Ramlibacter sp.]|jgi:hypothetical protein|uniref:hypothetical protein n=1 Tax=Ramlibacter sp. TaxID=1917967 RepID=UPI002607F494|nr:hypothetical protein [Ramlibacter sp.]MDB5752414.1 hypothetical protein [Ramlibacter sp.]